MSTPATQTPATNRAALAKAPDKRITSIVQEQVMKMMGSRTIALPGDYSVENALKAAWFVIQNSDQREKILACTADSQANALYDMCLQGLDPGKKQCYFIPYGNKCCMQRSYFGDEAVAKRVKPGYTFYSDVIYEGEAFSVKKQMTAAGFATVIDKHEQPFPRKTGAKILGSYVGTLDTTTGEDLGITLMDIGQIQQSWKKSKTYSANSNTFHHEQPDQACVRTVMRRHTKPIINSSNDAALLESVRRQDEEGTLAEVDEDAALNANGPVLSIEPGVQDAEIVPDAPAKEEERIGTPPADEIAEGQAALAEPGY